MRFTLPDLATEDHLLGRAQRGDKGAISAIYESYFASVYQFIRFRVEDTRQAEDIASDVFLKLLDGLQGRNGPRKSLRGWLFRVARNEINAHFGGRKQNLDMLDSAFEDWEPIAQSDDAEDLETRTIRALDAERARTAIRMLATDQQEVLLLRFSEGLSLEETAEIMGKRVGAIKSLQFRAVETLRNILGKVSSYA